MALNKIKKSVFKRLLKKMKLSVFLFTFVFGREEEKEATRNDCALPYEVGKSSFFLKKKTRILFFVIGMCRAAIPRFYFNIDTGKCEMFTWGGCGGNLNKFPDEESCMELCAGLTRADVREL